MSYIAFELDAIPRVSKVARSVKVEDATIGWGLVQMWEWCWREKTDRVTTDHLVGFFGVDCGTALATFRFLERDGSSFRVKGADKYLRIREAQSAAGKAAAGNLKQNQRIGSSSGSTPALPGEKTGSLSDERLAMNDERPAKPSAPRKRAAPKEPKVEVAPDPQHAPLVKALADTYVRERKPQDGKYPGDGRDAKAVTSLLAKGSPATIVSAYEMALRTDKYPLVRAIWELDRAFTHFVGTGPPTSSAARATDAKTGTGPLTATELRL